MSQLKTTAQFFALRTLVRGYALIGDPYAGVMASPPDRDPYAMYEKVRAKGDMVRSRMGAYVTPSREICDSVLRDNRFVTATFDEASMVPITLVRNGEKIVNPVQDSFLMKNPPDHTRLRRLVQPFFTPRALKDRTASIQKIVTDHLDRLGDRFDVVTEFASQVPIQVIADLLGVPDDHKDVFARWGSALAETLDGVWSHRQLKDLHATIIEYNDFIDVLIDERRRNPQDDIVSHLVTQHEDLSREDLVATTGLLLFAGFETTVNLISNGVLKAFENPHTVAPLAQSPEYAEGFVEEVLRLDPPVQYTIRWPGERLELAGVSLPKGMPVMLLLAAANRDPRVFEDPLKFDPTRSNAREHLAFSAGIHYCIGAGLSRIEGSLALHELFKRFPKLAADGPMTRRRSKLIRGALRLPVRANESSRSLTVK
ncbi:Cytochrome P450 [Lentzea albidocapillata subsp. violacea]|uniref:Cytochrome P450 n=1 Tax=Lentzea albidocapillata subsp. violacea TaxID=128104 RepID=A0A1G9U152_9PSEU|nr:cytochrome P450 [Lentzea albidocapillata]SDM53591.1 Cytochrome P450 [Lentzea albidocapillata subsp. violacea]